MKEKLGKTGSKRPLVVGVQPCSFCYPVIYASEKGYFKAAGLAVECIIFDNGSFMNEALAVEQLDIGVNGLAGVYIVCSGVCVLLAEPKASGTGAVYARPDSDIVKVKEIDKMLGSRDTLKGTTCLGAAYTLTQQQAYAYMDKFGLTEGKDYKFLDMDYTAANRAFLAGEGDIISADGLNFMDELERAGMVRICDYASATESPYCSGIIARKDVARERFDDVVLFLKIYYDTVDELMDDTDCFQEGYLKYVLENGREYTEETAAAEINARPLFTKEAMLANDYRLGTGIISAARFFAELGVIDKPSLKNLKNIDPSFLNKALGLGVESAVLE